MPIGDGWKGDFYLARSQANYFCPMLYICSLSRSALAFFLEIIEYRHGRKATIMISQLPVSDWYDVMKGNTTAADAILDRLVHTSVRFELKGASLRQKK